MLGCFENAKEAQGAIAKMIMDAMEELIVSYVAEDEVDQKIAERVNNISDKAKELAEALGRKVTKEELAEEAEIDIEDIAEAVRLSGGQIEYLETEN